MKEGGNSPLIQVWAHKLRGERGPLDENYKNLQSVWNVMKFRTLPLTVTAFLQAVRNRISPERSSVGKSFHQERLNIQHN